jgi:hypothetical protein
MAITFSKSISTTKLLNAYNNNVIEFASDSGFNSVSCSINIGGSNFVITPNTSNTFNFNLKHVVKALIDNKFADDVIADAQIKADTTLKTSYLVTYTITLTTGTDVIAQTYVFVKSIEQIANVSNRLLTQQHILNTNDLTIFKGYPFDIAHYSDGNVTLLGNISTTLSETATNTYRIFFLNRKTDFKIRVLADSGTYEDNACWLIGNDYELLSDGFNTLYVEGTTQEALTIDLKPTCNGVYLKWFNRFGGFSYWLFNSVYVDSIKTKTIDSYNVDFESIDNTFTTSLILGKLTDKERVLTYNKLTVAERLQINDLFSSPRVELYNGNVNEELSTWQTVKVKDGAFVTDNTKRIFSNVKLTIEINDFN